MSSRKQSQGQVRISAGEWRSRLLVFPEVDGLRPTGDRIRQTLFNWLGQSLHGKVCLDAFAGSGALGFEAASRGADRVVMCEIDARAVAALRSNKERLVAQACEIHAMDVLNWLPTNTTKFDVVFCDPPFSAGLYQPFLEQLRRTNGADTVVYLESALPLPETFGAAARWRIVKSAKAGHVHFGLIRLDAAG
jgi:16S rRNA (guanine966-N2)-methyltransferase